MLIFTSFLPRSLLDYIAIRDSMGPAECASAMVLDRPISCDSTDAALDFSGEFTILAPDEY